MAEPRSRARTQAASSTPTRTRAPRTRPAAQAPAPAQAPEPQSSSNERSLSDLLSELTDNLRALVQRELELVKLEMKGEIDRGVKGAGMFAGAGAAGFIALLLLAMAAAWGLAEVIAPGFAFLIVGVVFLAVAGILGLQGKKKFEQLNPVPRQTIETVKQDVQTAKESLSDGASTDQHPGNQAQQWSSAGADQFARRS